MLTCAKCQHTQRPCAGACACRLSGKDVKQHQAALYCPAGRFGSDVKPDGWDALPDADAPQCSRCGSGDHTVTACPIPADYDPVRDKDAGRCCS